MVARWDRLSPSNGSFIDYYVSMWQRTMLVFAAQRRAARKWWREVGGEETKMITPYNQFDNLIQSQIRNRIRKCDIIKSHIRARGHAFARVEWWATATATAYQISYYYFASISNQFPQHHRRLLFIIILWAPMRPRPNCKSTKWHFKNEKCTVRRWPNERVHSFIHSFISSLIQSFSSNFQAQMGTTRRSPFAVHRIRIHRIWVGMHSTLFK